MKRVGSLVAGAVAFLSGSLVPAPGRVVLAQGKTIDLVVGATAVPMDPALGTYLVGGSLGASVGTHSLRRAGAVFGARVIMPFGGASAQPDCAAFQSCQSYRSPRLVASSHTSVFVNVAGGRVRLLGGVSHLNSWKSEGSTAAQSWAMQGDVQFRIVPACKVTPIVSLTAMRLSRPVSGRKTYLMPTVGISF